MKIVLASLLLYALLAASSLGVRIATRGRGVTQLQRQIDAWWWIFPVVSLALLCFPWGLAGLGLLIVGFAARELFPYIASGHQRLIWQLQLLTCASTAILVSFAFLPWPPDTRLSWVFYLFIVTALNDIGQYVSGTLFGRDRIVPGISPNKTWQGLAGGVVISMGVSLSLGRWLQLASTPRLLAYGAMLALVGFLGDILFSAAKRRLGIKDFSTLIPGHGGMLDRVDSLVLTAPALYLLLLLNA